MKTNVSIRRDVNGIPHIEADNETDLYWGHGWVHATDRGLQMLMMRILGQGRVCELLDASDESLGVDTFFRRVNWSGHTQKELDALPPEIRTKLDAYCQGVNDGFDESFPWELKLLGCNHEPWRPEDTVLIARMIGYLTLVQSQDEMERLLVEMVQGGVSRAKLEELFPGILGGLDMDLIKKVKLGTRIVPAHVLWNNAVPRMMASNNWVVSGKKTASGKPIVANDPHLEVNRLPNVWSEIVLKTEANYLVGGSMPGIPGIVVGRNKFMAWGATYSFVDALDSWIEQCKDGKYFRETGEPWREFKKREEVIKRKKKDPVILAFYENEHGVLDGDPNEEGYYLAVRWAAAESGSAAICAILDTWNMKTTAQGMETLGKIETGWDFVFGDHRGHIGFQMSGAAPKRREGVSGFVPLPGWKAENDWRGFLAPEDMPRILDPEDGYFATANQDLNRFGKTAPINMPMGSYRADRINQLLAEKDKLTVEDMFQMHADVYSLQAELFMPVLKPLLPDTPQGKMLAEWDFNYDTESKGAFLFETFYRALYHEVFGKNGMGEAVTRFLADETGTFVDFYANFDRVLLSETSAWFGEETRDQVFKRTAADALTVEAETWGAGRQFTMAHMLFGGKLPLFLGFDRGPITGKGGRATIHQGQIYRSAGRVTTFMPSFRFVTDLAGSQYRSNLAGGPSDRRFSKWYCSDLESWKTMTYKTVEPESK